MKVVKVALFVLSLSGVTLANAQFLGAATITETDAFTVPYTWNVAGGSTISTICSSQYQEFYINTGFQVSVYDLGGFTYNSATGDAYDATDNVYLSSLLPTVDKSHGETVFNFLESASLVQANFAADTANENPLQTVAHDALYAPSGSLASTITGDGFTPVTPLSYSNILWLSYDPSSAGYGDGNGNGQGQFYVGPTSNLNVQPTPEPVTMTLTVAGLALAARRKLRAKSA